MKRRDLVRHLEQHGCTVLREGANHSIYLNPAAMKLFGNPKKPLFFGRLTMKTARPFIRIASKASRKEMSGNVGLMLGFRDKNATYFFTFPIQGCPASRCSSAKAIGHLQRLACDLVTQSNDPVWIFPG